MKVAILAWNASVKSKVNGTVTGALYARDGLRKLNIDTDIITLNKSGRTLKTNIPGALHFKYEDLDKLEYDRLLFTLPGPGDYELSKSDFADHPVFDHYLNLKTPFMCWFQHETDRKAYSKVFPYMLNHKYFRGSIIIHEGMKSFVPDKPVVLCPVFPPIDESFIPPPRKKRNLIITTCRLDWSKNPGWLMETSPVLKHMGYHVHIWGVQQGRGYYLRTIKPCMDAMGDRFFKLRGSYSPVDVVDVMAPAKYHANFMWTGGKSWHFMKRVELASVEALMNGCVPIYPHGTLPDWYPEDGGLFVDPEHYFGSIPHEIALADKRDRQPIIQKGLKAIIDNVAPMRNYENLRDLLLGI